jgi:hypothetical protein
MLGVPIVTVAVADSVVPNGFDTRTRKVSFATSGTVV